MPAVVVEVVGDTTKLTQELNKAQAQVKGFARTIAETRTRGDPAAQSRKFLDELHASVESGRELQSTMQDVHAAAATTESSLGGLAFRAGLAGLAVNVLSRNMSELGGNVGKVGAAFSDLTTGNIVGFVNNINSIDAASPEQLATNVSKLAQAAGELSVSAAKAGSGGVSLSLGLQRLNKEDPKKLAAAMATLGDTTKIAALQQAAAAQGFKNVEAAAKAASAQVNALHDAYVDLTKVHDPTSPGAIASDPTRGGGPTPPPKTKPLTAEQRRGFFDARIAREIDRVQDLKGVQAQVAALRRIDAEIQNRIDATNDITRRLDLEDKQVQVRRQAQQLLDKQSRDAAAEQARSAAEQEQAARAAAEQARRVAQARKDHLAAMKEAAEVARQEHLEWLEFALEKAEATPGLKNDIARQKDIVAYYKQRIRAEGRKIGLVRQLWREEQKLKNLQTERKKTAVATKTAVAATVARTTTAAATAAPRLSKLEALNRFADLRQFGGNMWSRAGAATVVVNQHFNAPTTDRHREARYAMVATRSVFDG